MKRDIALETVKQQLTEHRYVHTIGVMNTSIELAERFNADVKKAELAAIFHDYAKFRPKEEMKSIIIKENMAADLLIHSNELWHAPVGAYLVEKEVGITDVEILDAIKYHTTGRVNMNTLEKVIFLADYIEPGRIFPGVDEVRETAKTNLNKAVYEALRNTISFLLRRQQLVYPQTIHTYNDIVTLINERA
jgi:predicted HD superfamily hydrolase involved in NAD metabolism